MFTPTHSPTRSTVVTELQLPLWPNDLRGLPNAFARSALFNVANARKGARRHVKRLEIAALRGISVTYTGEELRQDDEDVFLQLLHIARSKDLSQPVGFTAHSMITEIGWTRNSGSYKRLADCIDRMKATAVAVTVEKPDGRREGFSGSLVAFFRWRDEGQGAGSLREWQIRIDPEIARLFGAESYTRVDWSMRLKLSPLEKWLHSFYHTHARPFAMSVPTIHELCGSEIPAKEVRKFRYKLKKALVTLVEQGFFTKAHVDPHTDMVHVERNAKHLSIARR